MTGKDTRPEQPAELRRRAEEITRDKATLSPVNFDILSPEEIRQILHELQVHQIELEMQNEELRTMQAEQDAARARYFDLYDLAPVGYCSLSEKGLILETNLAAATLLGEDRSMLVKKPITRFILKEDQDDFYLHCQQLFETQVLWQDSVETRSGQTGEPHACDLRMMKKDGTVFWVHLVAACVQAADSPPVYRVVISDITDRKQAEASLLESEQNFRTLANSGQAMIWTSGTDKLCNYFNRVWLEFTGRTPEQEMGNGWTEGVHPDDLQRCFDIYIGAFDRREKFSLEYRLRRYDGEYRWILDEGCPRYRSDSEFIGYIGHCLDITERRRAEEQSAKLEARLHQTQKMESIGSLAGGIAHDLNNILFPISGLSEMLLRDMPTGSPEHDSIEQIYKSAQRGSDLVKQILAFSHQSNPRKLPIRIQPILKEVLKLVRATIPRNIGITNNIQPDCGLVSAEPSQVHQIAMNLIINAYHAVEGNGGTIHVTLKEIDMSSFAEKDELTVNAMPGDLLVGRYACVTVYDTGTGIDQTLISKIFDPYFTTKALGKGTGLGLSVVYGIIKDHGGDIRVFSEIGKGTTFKVYLPILEDTEGRMTAAVIREWPTGYERILLVDDEEPIVRMERKLLERLGYQITARTSSPDALAVFRADPGNFDLVISDRGMPNMTGEQLARELFAIKPGIPIILCTGFGDEKDEQRAKALGIKGLLMKPVAAGDLAEMVRKVLNEGSDSRQVHETGQADAITSSGKPIKGT